MSQYLKALSFVFAILLISQSASANPLFSLSVTKTDESCPGNGSLTFTVSSTIPGSTISYAVYLLPNSTNPISTQSSNTLTGLTAGTYRVIATEAIASQSTTQQQDITIHSVVVPMSFLVTGTNEICGNDGTISVSVTSGTASGFEIFSGPVTYPVQTSHTFELLSAGVYQVRVFDNCGDGIVQNFTLLSTPAGLAIGAVTIPGATLESCDSIEVENVIAAVPGGALAYPLIITYTVHPPTGSPIELTQTIGAGSPGGSQLSQILPFYHNIQYTYDLSITDHCNNSYTRTGNVIYRQLSVQQTAVPKICSKALVVTPTTFVAPYMVNFLSSPTGFDPPVYNPAHPGPFSEAAEYFNNSVQIPTGTYIVMITDACGRTATNEYFFENTPTSTPIAVSKFNGCDIGTTSISLSSASGPIESVIMTAAPPEYSGAIPHDVSFNLASDGKFYMNSLPAGQYTFQTTDPCNTLSTAVTLNGYQINSNNINIIEKCNAFDLVLQHASNVTHSHSFWLQKRNPATGLWGHPLTNNSGGAGFSAVNAINIINNNTTLNITATGIFRIMKTFLYFGNGTSQYSTCNLEIYNFEFTGAPRIEDIYSFACDVNSDVVVIAAGVAPLIYRIIAKNGVPFTVQNGNQSIFLGLEPAVYTFQVEDGCGNILNRIFDISEPLTLTISGTAFCDGQPGSLSVPNLSFLTYEWWKEGDINTILSTTNSLQFPAFNTADSGDYYLRMTYPNNNSCVDITLNYTIAPVAAAPSAGSDTSTSFCERPDAIDLFTVLGPPFTTGGVWTEAISGIELASSQWSTVNELPGIYQFTYSVSNGCNSDSAVITIELRQLPQPVSIVSDSIICEGEQIALVAVGDGLSQYFWSGPNGFSATGNQIILDGTLQHSGTYSVVAFQNGCESAPAEVVIDVTAAPQFTVSAQCVGNVYTAVVTPADDALDTTLATYDWSGPNGFTAVQMPLNLTGAANGTYFVTMNVNGCKTTKELVVAGTVCSIPQGISPNGDGLNDELDLTGFGAVELKIYSRYGNVVFEQNNYVDQWHGQDFKGRQLPPGTYYYYVRTNAESERTGWIYLIREHHN